jgi:hypothetical protein
MLRQANNFCTPNNNEQLHKKLELFTLHFDSRCSVSETTVTPLNDPQSS